MKRTTFAVIAVIALVLTAGAAAAMPGSAPDDAAADDAQDQNSDSADSASANGDDTRDEKAEEASDNRSEDAWDDDRAAAADDARANATSGVEKRSANAQGPAVDLPAQVPDHVQRIHDLIGQFLDGEGDGSLGEQISGVDRSDAGNESAAAGGA